MGFGTYHHGPVKEQLISIRVVTPEGKVREIKSEDPEITNFLSTEGQIGHDRQGHAQGRTTTLPMVSHSSSLLKRRPPLMPLRNSFLVTPP